jgi:hypothetical protein
MGLRLSSMPAFASEHREGHTSGRGVFFGPRMIFSEELRAVTRKTRARRAIVERAGEYSDPEKAGLMALTF